MFLEKRERGEDAERSRRDREGVAALHAESREPQVACVYGLCGEMGQSLP